MKNGRKEPIKASWSVRRAVLRRPVGAPVTRLGSDLRCRRFHGVRTFDDGAVRFTVAMEGPGTLDFHYDGSTGEMAIERVRGSEASTSITVFRHAGRIDVEFGVGDCVIDRPIGAFSCNSVFGTVELRRQRGHFVFADGTIRLEADLPCSSTVLYDGAHGCLEVGPSDGSLALDIATERVLRPSDDDVELIAVPSRHGAVLRWRQLRGPAMRLRPHGEAASFRAGALPAGEEAVIVVGAAARRAVALESVIVRNPARS